MIPDCRIMVPKDCGSASRFRRNIPFGICCLSVLLLASPHESSQAQIVIDGKFSPAGPLTGPNYSITPAMGLTKGNNLFHSFSQFNRATGETATFSGPANIQNVLGRVTGGSPSSIDGTVRCDIPGANLFLINPNGFMFGPNATIDFSG